MPNASSIPPPASAADVVPRQRVADPDFWLAAACWILVAFSCLQVLAFSFGRDHGIYALVGEGILHGQLPYRDLWDFKPPGIFVIFAAAQALLGKSMLSIRLLEVAGLVGMVFGFRKLADVFFGEPRVGVVAGAIAVFAHAELDFWHTAQPEAFGGFLTVYALALATSEPRRSRRFWVWAGVGVLFGGAFLLKPTVGGGAFVCAAYLSRRELSVARSWKSAGLALVVTTIGSWLPILLCGAWFWIAGGWSALRWTLFEFTPGYTNLYRAFSAPEAFYYALQECFIRFSPLGLFGVLAAITMRPMHSREREGLMVTLGVVSINLAGVAMQNKFFAYHYSATLPWVGFIGGLGYYKLWRRMLAAGPGGIVAYVSFVVMALSMRPLWMDLSGTFWSRSSSRMKHLLRMGEYSSQEVFDAELSRVADYDLAQDRILAKEVRSRVPEGAPIFIWGFEPVVYWLSDSPSSSRFIYDVPQRSAWQRDLSRHMLMDELAAHPPEMIIVQRGDVFGWVTGNDDDSWKALDDFPELAGLLEKNYSFAATLSDFELYERRKVSPVASGQGAPRGQAIPGVTPDVAVPAPVSSGIPEADVRLPAPSAADR